MLYLKIYNEKCSLCRFGDGEFDIILNDDGTFSVINTFKYFEQSAKEALSAFSTPIYDENQKQHRSLHYT